MQISNYPEQLRFSRRKLKTILKSRKKPTITPPKTTIPDQTIRSEKKKSSVGVQFLKFFAAVIVVCGGVIFGLIAFVGATQLKKISLDGTQNTNTSIPYQQKPKVEIAKFSQPPPKIETTPVYQPPPIELPTPKPKITIADHTFHVSTMSWSSYKFTLTESSRVTGRFSAEGGLNSIKCLVMSDDDYINWSNSNKYEIYYSSGVVTVGDMDLRLAPGNYVLVFYNSAIFDSTTVTAKVESE